ncbi:MAG TPA: hypothetical protein DCO83_06390 [Mucilaginibacter sp.]|nr:hypothetical protein [Mucilaginibacter sp.]
MPYTHHKPDMPRSGYPFVETSNNIFLPRSGYPIREGWPLTWQDHLVIYFPQTGYRYAVFELR